MGTMNREDWLNLVADKMRPMFKSAGSKLPAKFRVTMSLTTKKKAIGVCYDSGASADETFEILIRLDMAEPLEVAAILAHELVHAAVGLGCGHKGRFRDVARSIGLEGPMTSTVAGPGFKASMAPILAEVGPFPHAPLDFDARRSSGPKKQGTRLLKVSCDCGYVVRMTARWIDSVGPAHCPMHGEMTVEGEEGDEAENAA